MSQQSLDNYFSKFLNPGRHRATAAPAHTSSAPRVTETKIATSPEEAAQTPVLSKNAAEDAHTPSESTAEKPLFRDSAGDMDERFLVLTDAGIEEETLLQPDTPAGSRKRGRDGDAVPPLLAPPPPQPSRRVTTLRSKGDASDDDDDLDLLLGKSLAEQVKAFDALMDEASSAVVGPKARSPLGKPGSDGGSSRTSGASIDDADSAVSIASLPWRTTSSHTMKGLADTFAEQFKYELKHRQDLFDSFEPFFQDKKLDRIEAATHLRRQFLPAPRIAGGSTGAIPGCQLREYQVEGVQFLLDNFHRGMSCILSDDMGLGKTAQIASFIHTLKLLHGVEGPHLIVAPLSTLTNWTRELARWAPTLRVIKYHGERKARQAARHAENARKAVFVTTPSVLNQEGGFFRKRTWVSVLVDEAHVLKGQNTKITRIAHKLTACLRVAITGTPVHNNAREVWNLMSFLYPSLVAGYDSRNEDTVTAAQDCARLLQHIMLRRTKEGMELGIPPRVDEPLTFLEPTYVQAELLAKLTAHALHGNTKPAVGVDGDDSGEAVDVDVDGSSAPQPGSSRLYAHLSHQRVVCNHPMQIRLLAADAKCGSSSPLEERLKVAGIPMTEEALIRPSAKMQHLDTLLAQLKAEGHRVLIFSNFTTTLDLLQAMCVLRHYSFERLDGSCTRVERELAMLRFNAASASCFVFLVTTTAGGVGVTLTGADTVILFDAHFNPQLDRQAADRAHRIGQTRTVHVHRLCLRNTVEEHIRTIAERKASLGDFIVEGGRRNAGHTKGTQQRAKDASGPRLTADDIRTIFERAEQQLEAQRAQREQLSSSSSSTHAADREDYISASQATTRRLDDALVEDLLEVEENGLPGPARQARRVNNSLMADHYSSSRCFVCGDIMHPLEPLLHCANCPKSYHAGCIGMKPPKPGDVIKRMWTCPRHQCGLCGKQTATDGAIFMCVNCPRAFCFDCLDPRYMALNEEGTSLLHIHKGYPEMESEDVEEKRSCYYLTCLRCCGVESSSDDEAVDDDDDGDEADSAGGEDDSDSSDSDSDIEVLDSDTD